MTSQDVGGEGYITPGDGRSLEKDIATAFHMASITILSILVFETILKALCAGTDFFHRKLETFDLVIVLVSFVVDLVCMQIMPAMKIQDFVFILAMLLPWRVIRVVNSLVVAVQDHEHFRLKLIYGRKKKIVNSLRESEIKLQLFRAQCNALKRLCFNEGIDESKIDQILMVEECVVNKAGKSKCKIKIDNSSVILLNDKSDFPRLSPRPSLLNLAADKFGRRKSMLPQCLTGMDRDMCLTGMDRDMCLTNSKDSQAKGILKPRARSNSESGRGTLSSPEDPPTHSHLMAEEKCYGGLNTPIIINRKSSLSSPIMATHVRNILNSLEDRCNQMNGSCSRIPGGRGSLDAGSLTEEKEVTTKRWERRVHSIDESPHEAYSCSRRASLQPQHCVDEDDGVLPPVGFLSTGSPSARGLSLTSSALEAGENSSLQTPRFFIPTTIQIDPPSNNSNYSLTSSSSSGSNKSTRYEQKRITTSGNTNYGSISSKEAPTSTVVEINSQNANSCTPPDVALHPVSTEAPKNFPRSSASPPRLSSAGDAVLPVSGTPTGAGNYPASPSPNHLKPKTLRTPSDIENENNLTQSESSDVCESRSNDDVTRNTSIEEIDDEFDNTESIVSISEKDAAVLSGDTVVQNCIRTVTVDRYHDEESENEISAGSPSSDKSTLDDVSMFRTGTMTAATYLVNMADHDLNSDSTSNLLS
ncbi:uncharacterized protein LOC131958022 [Physella acuta]|uniref:uncharacterized protein LOC131958022 n=1 Tax=Physella acuta TaxID=109671 RepID=UPI0027DE9E08|nr:uncharacterized protein LOC131958022 [Physella acuta]